MFVDPVLSKTVVPPEGSLDAKIFLIGQSPGSMEVRMGRPFVGPAGTLLDKMCHISNLPRNDCYITNLVKEQPPGNDISKFISFGRRGATHKLNYLEWESQLHAEILESKANVFVPLGKEALYALTRHYEITKYRGSILQAVIGGKTIKVIPTIHPAAALRQYLYQHFIVHDLRRVLEESKFPEVKRKERRSIIRPMWEEVIAFLEKCKKVDRVSYDIEVFGENLTCESFAITPQEALCIPYNDGFNDYWTITEELEITKMVGEILANPNIVKIGQNIIFDATYKLRKYNHPTYNIEDTMVGMAILHPDFPKGLDFITSIYTDMEYYKDDGKQWFKFGGSSDTLWGYNNKDTLATFDSWEGIQSDLVRQGNEETYVYQRNLIEPLICMQERGVRIDLEGLKEERDNSEIKIAELTENLHSLVGYAINPASPKQLIQYFYVEKGLPPYKSRVTGHMTVDDGALKRLSRKGYKEASIIRDIRKLSKLKGTYLEVEVDEDKRLRCAWNPVGTKQGRLSSSKSIFGTGTNLQNVPPAMKRFMLADPRYILYNMDLAQAENRIVAYIAPDARMVNAFETGQDVHALTASLIFNKDISEVSDEPGSCYIGGGVYSERFWGKKANHGLNYDLGYKTFAFIYEIPERDSKFLVKRYHEAYPGVRQYHAWVRSQLSKDRTLTNCFGRKRLFLDRWGDTLFKEAYSFIPQSTCVDNINRGGIIYTYYNQGEFGPLEMLIQVHDSIVFQIPTSESFLVHAEMILKIKNKLETPITWHNRTFSIPADLEMGFNLKHADIDNPRGLTEVKINGEGVEGLARRLHEVYTEIRTS